MITAYSEFKKLQSKGIYNIIQCKQGDKDVVLKQLREPYASQAKYKSVLHKEFVYGYKIDSPFVVKYLAEDDVPDYGHVIVAEFVDSRCLAEYLAEEHSDDEKIEIIKGIAEALDSLHQQNLICGVLNPYNILVTRQGDRPLISELRGTYNNTIVEPVDYQKYISPEQKDGTITVDRRTDIYSIGVLMRDMGFTLAYDDVIKKCCSIGRNDRFYDCDELIMALHGGHINSSNNNSAKINPQLLAVLALAAVVAIVVWLGVENYDKVSALFQSQTSELVQASDSTTSESDKTLAESTPDSSNIQTPAPVANGNDFESIVYSNIKETLDKVYEPYIAERQSGMTLRTYQSRLRPLRSQVKKAYKNIARDLGSITNDERQTFDKLFADYNKQKQEEFATCAELR